jgi:hypothetical protein
MLSPSNNPHKWQSRNKEKKKPLSNKYNSLKSYKYNIILLDLLIKLFVSSIIIIVVNYAVMFYYN